jgi:hypothetical protein
VQLVSATGESFSFTLLDGQKFTTVGVTTVALHPLPGQKSFSTAVGSDCVKAKRVGEGVGLPPCPTNRKLT